MPLTRGEIVGYDAKRMFYKFTMMNGVKTVDCEISNVALNDLARWETTQLPDRDAQFLRFRDLIEKVASDIFVLNDASPVQVFSKHVSEPGMKAKSKC